LDPAACGVLPLALGKATRLSRFIANQTKTYIFEMIFGIETDSGDAEGKIIREYDFSVSADELKNVLPSFAGEIEQIPPSHSAIHYGGARAYKLAQRGVELRLPARKVTIFDLKLLDFKEGSTATALLEVVCSTGTYIRSLCVDIAAILGGPAHVGFLCRKHVGKFCLHSSWILEELEQANPDSFILPPDSPLNHLPMVQLTKADAKNFCTGKNIEGLPLGAQEYFRVYVEEEKDFLGIGRNINSLLKPEVVLVSPNSFATD
jgi:tRNA pseudouridine55 synthase